MHLCIYIYTYIYIRIKFIYMYIYIIYIYIYHVYNVSYIPILPLKYGELMHFHCITAYERLLFVLLCGAEREDEKRG
jgi:hypothetical protein